MAPENNWLSFAVSSAEMMNSSSSQPPPAATFAPSDSHHYYFAEQFYTNGWANPKPEMMYSPENREREVAGLSLNGEPSGFHGFMESQIHHPPPLEDFLGGCGDSALVRYSESQTETQDSSSLTHIYDHGGGGGCAEAYFNEQQDLKTLAGFQAFSTNSESDVDDSASVGRSQQVMNGGGESVNGGYSQCGTGALSLAVNPLSSDNSAAAIVAVDSEGCKKITDTFGQRTSIYRGVTRHRWTGRYEAHLWDNSCRREGQARKGRQVYLGGYDKEDKAARSYDLAALKYWGPTATTNFPISNYSKELEDMKHMTKQEFIASLRRKSSGFSRGASIYRGVTRHHQQGRWQARIGRVAGNKDLYLGTFATEEEAAEAYDIAAIKFRGMNAVTNFEMSRYDVEAIMKSALPVGGAAKRLKLSLESEQKPLPLVGSNHHQNQSGISFGAIPPVSAIPCGVPFDPTTSFYHHHAGLFHHLHSGGSADMSSDVSAVPFQNPPAEFFIWPHQSY
ncbi:unnamed protein product [Cuscuta epithymum]|uniref:AP2/ERF domain-containing protein n=1 Tax=Cuscuta epithymum TaxID=186058 RepID=A0AAV0FDB9_9ASTE|nr:unnamed protein product [Cuscuta epithymum]